MEVLGVELGRTEGISEREILETVGRRKRGWKYRA